MEEIGEMVSSHGHGFKIEERLEGHLHPSLTFVFRPNASSQASGCELTFVCKYESVNVHGEIATLEGTSRYGFRSKGSSGEKLGRLQETWVREQLTEFIAEVLKLD